MPPSLSFEPQPPSRAAPVLAALVFHAGLLVAYLAAYRGDVSALICARADVAGRWPYEAVTTGFPDGYDGQYYYAVARRPWAPPAGTLDLPSLRHGRILYPALAWLTTGGEPRRLLWALPLINLAAVAGLAALGVLLAVGHGRSPWWGFLLPLAVNDGVPLLRDLTDPVATLAAAAVLAGWLRRWHPAALAGCAAAAVLAREQNAVLVALALGDAVLSRAWSRAAGLAGALLLGAAWVAALWAVHGTLPSSPENLAAPLSGLAFRWAHPFGTTGGRVPIHGIGVLVLTLQAVLCLALPLVRAPRTTALVGLAGAALIAAAGPVLFQDGPTYLRVFVWLPLAIWLWAVQTGRTWPALLLAPAALWPCFAVVQAWQRVSGGAA